MPSGDVIRTCRFPRWSMYSIAAAVASAGAGCSGALVLVGRISGTVTVMGRDGPASFTDLVYGSLGWGLTMAVGSLTVNWFATVTQMLRGFRNWKGLSGVFTCFGILNVI